MPRARRRDSYTGYMKPSTDPRDAASDVDLPAGSESVDPAALGRSVEHTGRLAADGKQLAIVAARFNEFVVDHLLDASVSTWRQLGGRDEDLTICRVPGSFELGVAALRLAQTGRYAAVVCLGCVIRGETDHYDHVVNQAARGVKDAGLNTGVPCIFGVLTCETLEQAIHRAGAKLGNAGRSAVMTACETADLLERVTPR